MKKYICSICGYVLNEVIGDPERKIAPGTKWEDVAEEKISDKLAIQERSTAENKADSMPELSFGEVSALCSNLSKACTKQYRLEEAELFNQLAEFYKAKTSTAGEGQIKDISTRIEQDLAAGFVQANLIATEVADRGALRALVWGEKVTKILNAILGRYEKQQDALLADTHVYVCEICGFAYIGEGLPDMCPVCKVPNKKITEVKRG